MVLSSVPARDVLGAHLRLPICQPPVSFPPLNLGKDLDVWQYENVISSLEAAEQESQQKRRARKEMEDQDDKANIVAVSSLCNELLKDAVDRQVCLFFPVQSMFRTVIQLQMFAELDEMSCKL